MKRKKNQRPTSEEAFRQAAEARLGLDFDYKQIKDRLDVDGMACRRAARSEQAPASGMPMPPYRRPAVAVFLMTFLLCATVGAGGLMIAHLAQEPAPPPIDTAESEDGTDSSFGFPTFTETDPSADDPQFHGGDTLTWEGVTYVRTNVILPFGLVEEKLGEVAPAKPQMGAQLPDRYHDNKAVATALDEGTPFYIVADRDSDLCVAVLTQEGFILYMVPDAPNTHT